MKRSRAQELNQPILAKFVSATVAGLAPRIMGIGPTLAVPKLFKQLNISMDDCDIVEINEAFASMAVYCQQELKIPSEKLNPRGGAIALGHPLGCTGARQIVTGLSECRRQKKKVLLTSMCTYSLLFPILTVYANWRMFSQVSVLAKVCHMLTPYIVFEKFTNAHYSRNGWLVYQRTIVKPEMNHESRQGVVRQYVLLLVKM